MSTETLHHPKYRPDIDGLRAIAVLAVVCFHAAPGRLPGGFIGVDIFFVISGFLITTIIVNNLGKGSFSFLDFYQRRIRRIFPALIIVLVFCLLFGSLLLTPEQFAALGKHVAGGAGFIANFLLWAESGYFDADSTMKPLLHLWSLSIEEQFYIFWPLLLWIAFARKLNFLLLVASIIIASFALNIFYVHNNATAAFYSPVARSWELLCGAILVSFNSGRTKRLTSGNKAIANACSAVGIVLITVAFFTISEERLFPGWWAILPVAGAASLILAGPTAWINRKLLSNPMLVWVGLISYPLYLVHWPILSFLRIMEGQEVSQLIRLYAVFASIGIAWLIYALVEKPIRFSRASRFQSAALVGLMLGIGIYGFFVYQQNGNVERIGTEPKIVNQGGVGHRAFFEYMQQKFYPCTPAKIYQIVGAWEEFKRCYQSKNDRTPQIALLGDSHAEHLFVGLAERLEKQNVVYYANGGLPFLSNEKFARIFEHLLSEQDIKVVVISGKWARELKKVAPENKAAEFDALLTALLKANKKVYLVDDGPVFSFKPGRCKYADRVGLSNVCQQNAQRVWAEREGYYFLFETIAEDYPSVEVIDVLDYFCSQKLCSMAKDGVLLFRDSDHLNVNGSQGLWRHIDENTSMLREIEGYFNENVVR